MDGWVWQAGSVDLTNVIHSRDHEVVRADARTDRRMLVQTDVCSYKQTYTRLNGRTDSP
jgi:hypothetical protein